MVLGAAILAFALLHRYGRLEAQVPDAEPADLDAGATAAPAGDEAGGEPAVEDAPEGEAPQGQVAVEHEGHVVIEDVEHEPQEVIVGCYVHNVEAIDLHSNSYSMSLELWMKWNGPIDPTQSFRITNVLDESSLTIRRVFDQPIEVEGYDYQRFHIEGRLFHKFWLGTFPLDWQRVSFELSDTRHPADVLVYVPDRASSGVDPVVRLPGWQIVDRRNRAHVLERESDYGMGLASPGDEYPAYEFSVRIERPVSFYFFKIIPPILITLACCLLVFLLRPSYVDARVGTPVAALLTAVFLQLTFTGALPSLGMMLLIDHVFNLTYAVIFVVLLSCIMTAKSVDEIEELHAKADAAESREEHDRIEARVELLDARMHAINRRTMIALPVGYLLGIVIVTLAVRGAYVFEMLGR